MATTTKGETIAVAIARLRGEGYAQFDGYPIDAEVCRALTCSGCGAKEPTYVAFRRKSATGHALSYRALAACRKCGRAVEL